MLINFKNIYDYMPLLYQMIKYRELFFVNKKTKRRTEEKFESLSLSQPGV